MSETVDKVPEPEMHRRKITLPDGRYLLFYTFGEEGEKTEPQPARDEGSEK